MLQTMEQCQVPSWDVWQIYLKVSDSYESHLSEHYTWMDEAISEAKKTLESTGIKLIPKTPSAKRSRKQVTVPAAGERRVLRSAANRDSLDSGVDIDLPKRARGKKLSRAEVKRIQNESKREESLREEPDEGDSDDTNERTKASILRSSLKVQLEYDDGNSRNSVNEDVSLDSNSRKNSSRSTRGKTVRMNSAVHTADSTSKEEKDKQKQEIQEKERMAKIKADEEREKREKQLADEEREKEKRRKEQELEEQQRAEEAKKMLEEREKEERRLADELREMEAKKKADEDRESEEKQKEEDAKQKMVENRQEETEPKAEEERHKLQTEKGSSLGGEIKLKKCSVILSREFESPVSSMCSPMKTPPTLRGNCVASDTGSGSKSSGTSSAGRLFNFVKSAVGALLPGIHKSTTSPLNRSVCAKTPSSSEVHIDGAKTPSSSEVHINDNQCVAPAVSSEAYAMSSDVKEPKRTSKLSRRSRSSHNFHSGPRLSLSKRRSSSLGNKAHLASHRRSSAAKRSAKHSSQISEEVVVSSTNVNSDHSDGEDSEMEIMDTPPQRVTRSKMRPPPPASQTVAVKPQTEAPAKRVTRSKMRVKPPQPSLAVSDDEDTPTAQTSTPSTVIKNKGSRVQKMQQMLCQNPSFGLRDTANVKVTTSSVKRLSNKRTNDNLLDSSSPPKRQCKGADFLSPEDCSQRQYEVASTYVKHSESLHPSSFLNQLKKKPITPMHSSTVGMISSFIQRNTPKVLTHEEIREKKRRELEAKTKKMEELAAKRNEMMQRKMEEQRRQREEQRQQVFRRRQELEQQQRDATFLGKKMLTVSSLRLDEAPSRMTTRQQPAADDKPKIDTLDKQKLRDKRIAEVEQRRKQEEEARRQQLIQQEKEKQVAEEQTRRRREQEEAERQHRLAEQRRVEEERKARLEHARQLEAERQRTADEQRKRDEIQRQKAKEEHDKRIAEAEQRRKQEEEARRQEREKQVAEEQARRKREQEEAERQHRLAEQRRVEEERKARLEHERQLEAERQRMADEQRKRDEIERERAKEDQYDMTPVAQKKVRKPASAENYDINDLHSDDSTDEEDKPRKKIPAWAQGALLKVALINQVRHPPDLNQLFGRILPPDLNNVFTKKKPRFNKRTSSAVWDTSILLPNSPEMKSVHV